MCVSTSAESEIEKSDVTTSSNEREGDVRGESDDDLGYETAPSKGEVKGDIQYKFPKDLPSEVVEKLLGVLTKRRSAFAKDLSEVGMSKSFELRLRVKDELPIVAKYYHMNPVQNGFTNKGSPKSGNH